VEQLTFGEDGRETVSEIELGGMAQAEPLIHGESAAELRSSGASSSRR
jgi:hypothetical protein